MKRRTLIQAGISLGLTSMVGTPTRGPVDPAVIDGFVALRGSLVTADSLLGPGSLIRSADEQVNNIVCLFERVERGDRPRLFEIAALFAEFCGWLSDDLGDLATGSAWSRRALEWAFASGNTDIAAFVLMRMSQQAQLARERGQAVALAEAAIRHETRVANPAVRAAVYQQAAHASALDGDEVQALGYLERAHGLAEQPPHPGPHSLASYCTPGYVEVQHAAVHSTLGNHGRALDEYQAVMAKWPRSHYRERGFHLARRSVVAAAAGLPDAAVEIGSEALDIARNTRSRRTMTELRTSVRHLDEWRSQPLVRDFADAVTTGSEWQC